MMLYIKYKSLVVLDKKIFENCILKSYFLPRDLLMQTTGNSLNNFVRGPPWNHSCEVWSKSMSGLRGEEV